MNYLNEKLPVKERVQDLLNQLTLEEKINFLSTHQLPVKRLNIREFSIGQEIARGLVNRESDHPSTVFPQPIGLAATFDKELMLQIGRTASREARAYYNQNGKTSGVILWGPTVDLSRDPRWGRTEECYGEDPFLTGEMTAMYTKGLKGDDSGIWATIPALKHFCANNHEQNRDSDNANLNPRLKYEHYYQAFKKPVVKGGAHSVMTAYNAVCHAPAVVNHDLKNVLKKDWGLGFVVTDAGDFVQNLTAHHVFHSHAESLQACLYAGTDCVLDNRDCVIAAAHQALDSGLISEADIDLAVGNVLESCFLLGRFNKSTPYDHFTLNDIHTDADKALNLRAARENMILLDNHQNVLPLNPDKIKKIGLFGQNADCNLMDWYTGISTYNISIRKALEEQGCEVIYDPGWNIVKIIAPNHQFIRIDENNFLRADADNAHAAEFYLCQHDDKSQWTNLQEIKSGRFVCIENHFVKLGKTEIYGWFTSETLHIDWHTQKNGTVISDYLFGNQFCLNEQNQLVCRPKQRADDSVIFHLCYIGHAYDRLLKLSEQTDVILYCGGNDPQQVARECYDRESIELPELQQEHLSELLDHTQKSVILLLISSYPYTWHLSASRKLNAVLYTSHAGPELGHAVVETLFGKNNPAGRCPLTWYACDEDLPDIKDYDIMKTKMTYRYFDGMPLYPFGFGLSYSYFTYEHLQVNLTDSGVRVTCAVTNRSALDGDEVVQVYFHAKSNRIQRPNAQLCAFSRMYLKAGETKLFSEFISFEEFEIYDVSREKFCLEDGDFDLLIGASSMDIKLCETVHIPGEIIPPRDLTKCTKAELYDTQINTEIFTNPLSGATHVRGLQWHNELIFQNCDFTNVKSLTVHASAPIDPTEISVFLDDHFMIKIPVPISDGYEDFHACTVNLIADGCHNLKLTFGQHTCIKSLQINR